MRSIKIMSNRVSRNSFLRIAAVLLVVLGCFPAGLKAQEKGQRTFASPEAASEALVNAVESRDEKALREILGPDAKEIVSSGDEAQDEIDWTTFLRKYREMHRQVAEPDDTTTIYIGAENWPAPIPLVNKGGSWYFDTNRGKQEILYRRVGENEMSTIAACQELVAAEKDYYDTHQGEYAGRIASSEGQRNGLYWRTAEGQALSPIGPLLASAVVENSGSNAAAPTPYYGYYYRILTSQGKNAPGGAKSYVDNGKVAGFAFLAYPAEYRSSGVMTFIVGMDGIVYQKDLGDKTEAIAKAMSDYDPDSTWQKAETPQEEESAAGDAVR